MLTLVYDTLLWRDANGVAQPWLATSIETSADGRLLTLHLANGAQWQDGTPVTADDVAFTFRFLKDRPHARFTPELDALDRVDVSDPFTVAMTLRDPSPGFVDQPLADVPILPEHLWRGLEHQSTTPPGLPVGSGPYRLVDHRPGESYVFEAQPGYFRGPPAVTRIEVPIISEAEATFQALEHRRVDMLPVNLSQLATKRLQGLAISVRDGPSYVGTALVLNDRRPPFDQVDTRRAVAKALDPARVARAVGDAIPALKGYVHPDSPWASSEALAQPDEAGARSALVGLASPPIDVLVIDNDAVKSEAARQVTLALGRVGFAATAKRLSRQELEHALGEDGSTPSFDAAITVIPPLASYDPDFLSRLFGSDPTHAPLNFGGYRSAAFDELARRVATVVDPVKRRTAVDDLLRLVAADVPAVPLYFSVGAYAFRPAIYDGWGFVKGAGILDKRSFVEPRPEQGSGAQVVPPAKSGRFSGLVPLALGLVGLAAILAVVAVVRRR